NYCRRNRQPSPGTYEMGSDSNMGERPIYDSAGKFCPDKWTKQGEKGRVEEKGHERFPHDDVKEDEHVAAHPTAGTHPRSDQKDSRTRVFQRERWPCICEMHWAPSIRMPI